MELMNSGLPRVSTDLVPGLLLGPGNHVTYNAVRLLPFTHCSCKCNINVG